MIRVAALTPGRQVPSARFRVRQYIRDLGELGIGVDEFTPWIDKYARLPGWPRDLSQFYAAPVFVAWQTLKLAARGPGIAGSWRREVTWLQRDLLPGIPTLEPLLGGPLVFDVDDSVWLKKPWGQTTARRIAEQAKVVIAGNDFVADWFSDYASDVRVVPTAIDSHRFSPAPASSREEFTVGWTGTAGNFHYLEAISAPLGRFLDDHPDARLLIMAERPPRLDLPPGRMSFRPWSAAEEVQAVQAMDAGLMPLSDDAWARGKCSFKMLQYMACGVPTVVSPVGSNRQVLAYGESGIAAESADDWYDAMASLYRDRDLGRRLGETGRRVVVEHFDRELVAGRLARIFREVADEPVRRKLATSPPAHASRGPNFFILGAPKCGTTAMHNYLSEHPEVFVTDFKEPHFFATDLTSPYYVRSLGAYLQLFAPARSRHKVLGEASVWYLYSRRAASGIRRLVPRAKLIVMLRNPVDLFVSYHNQALASLYEDQWNAETAWSLQEHRRRGERIPSLCEDPQLLQYRDICSLGSQVERLFGIFPRSQVHTVLFDDFVQDPRSAYRGLLRFLGISDDGRSDFPRINEAYELKVAWLEKVRRHTDRLVIRSPLLSRVAPPIKTLVRPISRELRIRNQRRARRARLDPTFRLRLMDEFRDDVELLGDLLDRDLSHWTDGRTGASSELRG